MNIEEMNLEQIEQRMTEIKSAVNTAALEELTAMNAEIDELEERRLSLTTAAENIRKQQLREQVAEGAIGTVITTENLTNLEARKMTKTLAEVRSSHEYAEAYAEMIKTNGKNMAEVRALMTDLVEDGSIPVPTIVENTVERAWEKLQIADKCRKLGIKGSVRIPYEYSADPAVIHEEGSAAIDEENLVIKTTDLIPQTVKKMLKATTEVMEYSAEQFLTYVYEELAYQVAKKLDDCIVVKMKSAMLTKNVWVSAFGANTVFAGLAELTDGATNPVVIMKKSLFYNTFMALTDDNHRPIYNVVSENGGIKYMLNSCPVIFSEKAGDVVLVADLDGVTVNYPAGNDIKFITDPYSEAEKDIVKIVAHIGAAFDVCKPGFVVAVAIDDEAEG